MTWLVIHIVFYSQLHRSRNQTNLFLSSLKIGNRITEQSDADHMLLHISWKNTATGKNWYKTVNHFSSDV